MRCMKKRSISQSSPVRGSLARALGSEGTFFDFRASTDLFVRLAGVLFALFAFAASTAPLLAHGLGRQRNEPPDIVNINILTPVSSGAWIVTGSLNAARFEHTATLLLNDIVLVAGGGNGTDTLASTELYDPATGNWSSTGSLNIARSDHTATLLLNGMVLVAGGTNGTDILASAELYDPATGIWTGTGSLNTARLGHTATLLPNGMVLVAGGSNSSGMLASAELYDPASGSWSATGSLNIGRSRQTATLRLPVEIGRAHV